VAAGLISSLARPDGNLTGVSFLTAELMPKRLELLSELVPRAEVLALLVNPENPQTEGVISDMRQAAHAKGVQLQILKTSTIGEIDAAFASLPQPQAGALAVQADPFFIARRAQLVALTSGHAIPAIYECGFVVAGGLISYGASITGVYRQVGACAGRILNGARPADLPVQQPTTFELVVNLKTAKALGLTVPPSILARADEVIE
jgi:putative tryptophan/tyrosine transport system substrate-binding protein